MSNRDRDRTISSNNAAGRGVTRQTRGSTPSGLVSLGPKVYTVVDDEHLPCKLTVRLAGAIVLPAWNDCALRCRAAWT